MHAERLNSIAAATSKSYRDANLIGYLDSVIGDVARRLENPADRSWDERISNDTKALLGAIKTLTIDAFPPTWKKTLTDLNFGVLLPENIRKKVDDAFQRRFVDSDLQNSLESLKVDIQAKLDSLSALENALDAVGVGYDELESEQVEFAVTIPRESITDDLGGLNKQFGRLNTELLVLSSIMKTEPPPLTVNSISSSDFNVSVNLNIDLADIIAFALLALAIARRDASSKIKALSVPALKDFPGEIMEQAKAWAAAHVKQQITEIVRRLPKECPASVDAAKLESKEGPVQSALEYFEDRMENGVDMEVRTAPDAAREEPEVEGDKPEQAALLERHLKLISILKRTEQLKAIEQQSAPILSLTESKDADPPDQS